MPRKPTDSVCSVAGVAGTMRASGNGSCGGGGGSSIELATLPRLACEHAAVRIASWTFVACMLLGMICVFLPSAEVQVGGVAVSHRATLSLYRAETNREVVRRWLQLYGHSSSKRMGGALVAALLPHTRGAINDHLGDVHDAMTDLEGVSDEDVKTAGTVLAILLWSFLALHVLAGGLVVRGLVRQRHRGFGLALLMLLAIVIAGVAVALYFAWGAAVFEVNDDIGKDVVGLALGAYVAPVAALLALGSAVVIAVGQLRRR